MSKKKQFPFVYVSGRLTYRCGKKRGDAMTEEERAEGNRKARECRINQTEEERLECNRK